MTRRLLAAVAWPTICGLLGALAGLYTRWRYQ